MSSRFNTYTTRHELVVHKQSDFVADCVCNGTVLDQITWKGKAATSERTDIVNSDTIGRSILRLRNASKQDEDRLCCPQSKRLDCRHLVAVDKPVDTLSFLEWRNMRTASDNNSRSVCAQCTLVKSSTDQTDLFQCSMHVFINNNKTSSYDNGSSNSIRTDVSGNSLSIMTYKFRQEVHNGDVLDCRWICEDGSVIESESRMQTAWLQASFVQMHASVSVSAVSAKQKTTYSTTETQGIIK